MPTFPLAPLPKSVSLPGITDPMITHRVDEGYEVRRSRYSRGTRRFRLDYIVNTDEYGIFLDFLEREIRNGVLSCEWTFPYPHSIVSITTGAPNVVTTAYRHGYQTGDTVEVSGTPTQNGTHTITRLSATAFGLQGTSGGTGTSQGFVAAYFPVMLVRLPEGMLEIPEKLIGPPYDNKGAFRFSVTLEEGF